MFGETEYNPSWQYFSVAIEEQLFALSKAADAGKVGDHSAMFSLSLSLTHSNSIPCFQVIWYVVCFQIRYIGLSNETPYGVMKFAHTGERFPHFPKLVSLQVLELNILVLILFSRIYCY